MDEPKLRGYAIERPLGRGGSGDVWQARVTSSGARVALKRIAVANEQQRQRAEREAALLAALDHPNLVRLHAAVPTADALVLVLDLADGGSLADVLQARGRLAPGEVITALAPIAAAVAYLHDEGVVHCDISPGNVLFTRDGRPLLADVGVARLTGDEKDAAATPAYVDPMVAAGGVPTQPSDVFMLGAVALHALTGSPPWPAETGDAALALATAGRPDFGGRLVAADVPAEMTAVVCRALSADPHRRGTAAAFALDLGHSERALAVELAAGQVRPHPVSGPRHAARPQRAPDGRQSGLSEHGARGRPAFERPHPGGTGITPLGLPTSPPTRLVAPRPRPVIPRRARRRLSPRLYAVGGACLVAAALAAGGTLWAQASGEPTTPRAEVESHATTATDWTGVLDRLDRQRAVAFADRRPDLLRRVYVPGPLLSADTALLLRIVPPGCGLTGARTRYTRVQASTPNQDGPTTLTVTATLDPSRLECAGAQRGTAAGTGPTRLRLQVVSTAAGPRIAGQQPVS